MPQLSPEKIAFLQEAGKKRLLNFIQLIDRKYVTAWFHELIAQKLEDALEKVVHKEKVRIIITIPPRHGKTKLAATYFPAWSLGKYPDLQFILSTYGADLSEKTGLETRDVINSEGYQGVFPGIELRPDVKAKARWMTNKKGSFTGVGIGGAVTGTGGNFIIMDDPHKSREEAESATIRETVWQYYKDTLYSRLEGFGAVVIIMQRWHTDDLVGRVLEQSEKQKAAGEPYDEWEVINFPAIAEEDEFYQGELVRRAGEALWPSRFPLEVLYNIRAQGIYKWASQYQQDPIYAASQEFKEFMFKKFKEEDLQGKYLRYFTFVDPAISMKHEADNTVVLTVAKEVNGPNWYRIREDAGHFTPTQTVDLIFLHGATYKSTVAIETVQYQQALKYAVLERQKKDEFYFVVLEVRSSTNKETRIRGLLPLYMNGVIHHRDTDMEYEREALAFPRGKRDDRLDAMSMGLQIILPGINQYAKQYKKKVNGYFKRR